MTEKQYNQLLERIVNGAQFIETLSKDDPKYQAALKKYEKLYEQARVYRQGGK